MIKIVDFATSFDKTLWDQFQKYVLTTTDTLAYNYVELYPEEFESFPVVIIDNKIVCFSALQVNESWWGKGIGRVSTRMWIHPDFRHKGKFTSGSKFLNTTYCLPLQLAKAKLLGLDCVFVSREHNPRAFEEYLKLIKVNCKVDFVMKPTKYALNGPCYVDDPESMKQWVMVHNITDTEVWESNMEQYALEG